MTIAKIEKNHDDLTMTVTAEFDAPVERVWQLWANPRKLERWWGPPTYPATVVDHDLTPGGTVNYFMTGPEGDRPHGWWRIISVAPPHTLEFEDGFADEAGIPNPELPTTVIRVSLSEKSAGGTRMTITSKWQSLDQMNEMIAMGMEEGISAAIGQMDALLA